MVYVKGPNSILPELTYSNPSNFLIGDSVVTASSNIGDKAKNGTGSENFIQRTINFMYHNPETMEDVVIVEGGEYYQANLAPLSQLKAYAYKEESRTIEGVPSSVFGSWENYTCSSGFDSLFFDFDTISNLALVEF